MPIAPSRPKPLQGRVFRGTDAVRAGLLTAEQLRSTAWRPLRKNVYADASLPVDHGLHLVGASLVMPSDAVFTGISSAWLHGIALAEKADPVSVAVPSGRRWRSTGARVWRTDPGTAIMRRGLRTVVPAQAAADALLHLPMLEAVVLVDAVLARYPVTAAVDRLLTTARGLPAAAARSTLTLCDGRAESPQESRLRVVLQQAGLPAPVPQFVVTTVDGAFVARVDLGWPRLRVALEYDGAWHGAPGELTHDRGRLNALVLAGWTVVHVTAAQLKNSQQLVAMVRATLARAAR